VVPNIDPQDLAEYDSLTTKQVKLEAELAKVRERREELRIKFLGGVIPAAVEMTPATIEATPTKKKGLSVWERISRKPPRALQSTVEVVRQLGRATNKQVAEKLGIPLGTASLRLSRATKDGWLSRVGQGVYEVEPLGGVMVT
jgi:hypothetical protein